MEQQAVQKKAEYPINVGVAYPEKLSRLSTFFRIILLIPQIIVFLIVGILAGIFLFFAWWIILLSGKYPKGFFKFVTGYLQWGTRVAGYYCLLTDKYPPFGTQ